MKEYILFQNMSRETGLCIYEALRVYPARALKALGLKQGHFSHFGGTEKVTSGALIKIPRTLFETN